MICESCKTLISEPYYIEVNARVIKFDLEYVKSLEFTPQEKSDLSEQLIFHKSCWQS